MALRSGASRAPLPRMTPLLMIPGPIEVSDAVAEAIAIRPPSHVAPSFIEAHGRALERMRAVWLASSNSQPFVVPGSGTLAMEMAATNLVEPGDSALVVNTGYFGDRMAEMLRRRGAAVRQVTAAVGDAPSMETIERALHEGPCKAVFATHVDTSTGVRVDAEAIAGLARSQEILSVFDGVCATAGERFAMEAWGADIYFTASQKAIGLPPGLALLVASPRALAARECLEAPPPLSVDFASWLPIMRAYEERRPSYFSTPATTLVSALDVSLGEILAETHLDARGIEARFRLHARAAEAMRAAWAAMDLELLCRPELAADTLSAIRYPSGVDAALVARVKDEGVVVAGGLHPAVKNDYFRVGHMGVVVRRPDRLLHAIEAVARALVASGRPTDVEAARQAATAALERL
jgi:alanine-glyoxylate transaminase / serine-glyoxylate transaminase / serine-pyruvate transaminase